MFIREMDIVAAEAFGGRFHDVVAQDYDQASLASPFNAELGVKTGHAPVAQVDRAPVS